MFDDVRALLRQAHDILACASYPPEHNADLTAAYERGFYDGKKQKYIKREWVGLTDEERVKCYETTGHYQTLRPQDSFAVSALARAIEAALRSKNA